MWKRFLAFYDWLGRIDFARTMLETLFGKSIWTKAGVAIFALAVAALGWFSSLGLAPWARAGVILLFVFSALAIAHLALWLWLKLRKSLTPASATPAYEAPFLMPLRELFARIPQQE